MGFGANRVGCRVNRCASDGSWAFSASSYALHALPICGCGAMNGAKSADGRNGADAPRFHAVQGNRVAG